MKPKSSAQTAVLVAFVAAVVGALLAVLYAVSNVNPPEQYMEASATRVFESVLLISEAVVSACFGLIALLLRGQVKSPSTFRVLSFSCAALRAGFLLWQFGLHWRPGWYYIMDPAGSTASSWTLLLVGLVQLAAFFIAGVPAASQQRTPT